jgi:hypothetical protein
MAQKTSSVPERSPMTYGGYNGGVSVDLPCTGSADCEVELSGLQ